MEGVQCFGLQKPGQKTSDNRMVLGNISNSSCSHNGNVECGRYDLRKDLRGVVRMCSSCLNSYLFFLLHGVPWYTQT